MAFNLDNYEDVASRVKRFQDAYPMGRIQVRVLDFDKEKGSILLEANIYRTDAADELPAGTDIAMEWASKSPVSKNWWVENAATSAVGRAIALVLPTEQKATRENMQQVESINAKAENRAPRDPWAVSDAVDVIANELGGELLPEAPICAHGHMVIKEGENAKKEPYKGYVCPEKDRSAQCKAQWMTLNSSGKWVL